MSDLPQGIFLDLAIEDVTEIRNAAVDLLKEGKTLMSGSSGGQNFTKQMPMSIEKVLIECRYAMSFLIGRGQVRRVRTSFNRNFGGDPYYGQ